MTIFQRLIHRKMFFLFLLCPFFVIAASETYAGFEWIPQKKKPEMQQEIPVTETPTYQEPVPVDDVVLPLPSDDVLSEPVMVAPEPMPMEKSAEAQPAEAEKPSAPTRIVMMPKEEPNSGAVVNTMPEEPSLPPIEISNSEELKKPPFPMTTTTKVVMPEDAPLSAVEQTEKNNVIITAFPENSELNQTADIPMPTVMPNPPAVMVHDNIVFAEAVGFASDIPLALALGQVVPADYAYSFGEGVNPGLRVSWNGGRPWNEVVTDMIVPLGYSVLITHKSVRISLQKVGQAPAFIEPAAGSNELESVAQEADALTPTERTREIKRVGITDPGIEEAKNPAEPVAMTQTAKSESLPQNKVDDVSMIPEVPKKMTFWTAEAGASLRETLSQWSDSAGAELVWEATYDFQLPAAFEVQGSFEKAVNLLLKHGLGQKNETLSHSLAKNTEAEAIQVIINNAA